MKWSRGEVPLVKQNEKNPASHTFRRHQRPLGAGKPYLDRCNNGLGPTKSPRGVQIKKLKRTEEQMKVDRKRWAVNGKTGDRKSREKKLKEKDVRSGT
jgi:hypothetical protein